MVIENLLGREQEVALVRLNAKKKKARADIAWYELLLGSGDHLNPEQEKVIEKAIADKTNEYDLVLQGMRDITGYALKRMNYAKIEEQVAELMAEEKTVDESLYEKLHNIYWKLKMHEQCVIYNPMIHIHDKLNIVFDFMNLSF